MTYLTVRQKGSGWVAGVDGGIEGGIAFDGEGATAAEAIGKFMIANRESLGFNIDLIDGNGRKFQFMAGRPEVKRPKSEGAEMADCILAAVAIVVGFGALWAGLYCIVLWEGRR